MVWPLDSILGSSAPPAARKPPPPRTTRGASTAKPTQECPRNAKHPCDVNKLMIKVKAHDKEAIKILKLDTTKVRRFEAAPDVKDGTAVRLLKHYDLLIDCLANPKEKVKAEPAEIEGRAYYTSPACETHSHPLLTLTPLGTRVPVTKPVPGAAEIDMAEYKAFAMASWIDAADRRKEALDGVWNVFAIIESFMRSMLGNLTEVDLRADACGKRARGDGGNLNQSLLACVRVFRASKWAIGIKIPAMGSVKKELKQTVDPRGVETSSSSRESTSGFGTNRSATSSKVSGHGALADYSYSQKTQRGDAVDSYSRSRNVKDGSVTQTFEEKHSGSDGRTMTTKDDHFIKNEDIKKRLDREHGFDLVVSVDDKEIELGEGIKKIKEMVAGIKEAIEDIEKLCDAMPQLGWKFAFDVSVLEGTIICECAPEYIEGVKAAGRYYAVQHKFSGKIEVKVFSITVTLSFGVEARALDSGLVLKVEGKLTLESTISKDIKLDFFSPTQELDVGCDAGASITVVGYISAFGKTLADAQLSVSGGLEFKGKFAAELSTAKFHLSGKLKSKAIALNGYIHCTYWWDKKIDPPKVLLKEHELYGIA